MLKHHNYLSVESLKPSTQGQNLAQPGGRDEADRQWTDWVGIDARNWARARAEREFVNFVDRGVRDGVQSRPRN